MRISTSPTSNAPLERGFTLIEILVVVVIIGVLAATVMLSFTGGNLAQELRGEAERAALRMELARSNALQRNREWGVLVQEDGYSFLELDPYNAIWVEQSERPLARVTLPDNMRLRLETEGFELPEMLEPSEEAEDRGEDELPEPNLILCSSGEVTPFTLTFAPEWEASPWFVRSDGLSRVRAERDETI